MTTEQITTVEQLDALPEGSVILTEAWVGSRAQCARRRGRGHRPGHRGGGAQHVLRQPELMRGLRHL